MHQLPLLEILLSSNGHKYLIKTSQYCSITQAIYNSIELLLFFFFCTVLFPSSAVPGIKCFLVTWFRCVMYGMQGWSQGRGYGDMGMGIILFPFSSALKSNEDIWKKMYGVQVFWYMEYMIL